MDMIQDCMYSSKKHDWCTPDVVLDVVKSFKKIDFDPCASKDSDNWFARDNWCSETLKHDYIGSCGLVFINPPYGRTIIDWVRWINIVLYKHEVITLLPSRTDTKWFNEIWQNSQAFCFWRGRIKFVGAKTCAPFPSVLFYHGTDYRAFCETFRSAGIVGEI